MSYINYHPIVSILENNPGGNMVAGLSGTGKSYFLNELGLITLSMSMDIIYVDMKNDSKKLNRVVDIPVIDVNDIKPGAMNPFKVLNNVDSNLILDIIRCIVGEISPKTLTAISPVVDDFVKRHRRSKNSTESFSKLASYLYSRSNEEARNIGTLLKNNENTKYGPILFGEDHTDSNAISINQGSTIISLFNLPLPINQANVKDLNSEQKFSSGLVFILCKMLLEALEDPNRKPTLLIFDESQIAFVNKQITDVIMKFLTLGRSLMRPIILAAQDINAFPDNIDQHMSNKFMFKMSSDNARNFLEMFDNSEGAGALDRESIISKVTNAKTGECFMIDVNNKGGFFKTRKSIIPGA